MTPDTVPEPRPLTYAQIYAELDAIFEVMNNAYQPDRTRRLEGMVLVASLRDRVLGSLEMVAPQPGEIAPTPLPSNDTPGTGERMWNDKGLPTWDTETGQLAIDLPRVVGEDLSDPEIAAPRRNKSR